MRNVGEAIVAMAAIAERKQIRRAMRRAGEATPREQVLYAEQRRRDLPAGHPYV